MCQQPMHVEPAINEWWRSCFDQWAERPEQPYETPLTWRWPKHDLARCCHPLTAGEVFQTWTKCACFGFYHSVLRHQLIDYARFCLCTMTMDWWIIMVVNSVHWFRKGLRLHDNPSLQEALNGADTVCCVYILDPWFAGSANVGVNRWRSVL